MGGNWGRESHQKLLGGSLQWSNVQRGGWLNFPLFSPKSSDPPAPPPAINNDRSLTHVLLHVTESRFLDPWNFCLWNPESWTLEVWNTTQGIRNPTKDWNPKSNFHWQRIWNPLPGIQNLRLSGIPCMGRQVTMLQASISHPGKTVNTGNISGMLLCCKKKANQAWENWTASKNVN